jgi:hypothetical protein
LGCYLRLVFRVNAVLIRPGRTKQNRSRPRIDEFMRKFTSVPTLIEQSQLVEVGGGDFLMRIIFAVDPSHLSLRTARSGEVG